MTTHGKTSTLTEATAMGLRPIFHVDTRWVAACGRKKSHRNTFQNKAEALNWLKWCC